MTTNINLEQLEGCDFIDFGCKTGGSMHTCEVLLGGKQGLGVDRNPTHVEAFREKGGRAIVGDITNLDLPDKCVRFVCISHVLEHLPDETAVRHAIVEAARVADEFVCIIGPYFDADRYLHDLGLKFFWSDWKYHPCHVDAEMIARILHDEGLPSFTLRGRYPIRTSAHDTIHPLDSPRDQHEYDAEVHPAKPSEVVFERAVFREVLGIVCLRPIPYLDDILERLKAAAPLGPYSQLDFVYSLSTENR